jgi:hypothetical protein
MKNWRQEVRFNTEFVEKLGKNHKDWNFVWSLSINQREHRARGYKLKETRLYKPNLIIAFLLKAIFYKCVL